MVKLEVNDEICLKLLSLSDAPTLFTLVDENRQHLKQWLPWLDFTQSVHDSEEFIKTTHQQLNDGLGLMGGIYLNHTLVGMCGYHPIDKINGSTSIGYWLAKKYQGQGVATQCVSHLIDYAFETLTLNKVSLSIAEHNYKSQDIALRLGFVHKEFKPDAEFLYDRRVNHICYWVAREEWLAHQAHID
ncbi:GNAT family N-acetyltransferase [Pseudoalteromonas umbrosa]|uniref:GNAT family N-acetyltransferase n=1 Tax=Pseudoalteromonas umbrosa TaxID=3048489 RepID=UPI0024C2AF92|nr:GNAT family protein [Pseudoalteromonas sp. B95]MDK1286785.1 GNAT family protein [Pseudoalteromonas sp. B95]